MRAIDDFLRLAGAEVAAKATDPARSASARAAAMRVAALLGEAAEPVARAAPRRLPACRHLAAARAETRPDLAEAFAALEPELEWRTRAFADAPADFADNHANARLLGPDGLERRGELVAGFSLVAPGVTYPEHDHPPEEIYLVLSGGEWWQAGGAWHAPGPCGIVHNPPGIRHAMRGTSVPLLAIWFLLPN